VGLEPRAGTSLRPSQPACSNTTRARSLPRPSVNDNDSRHTAHTLPSVIMRVRHPTHSHASTWPLTPRRTLILCGGRGGGASTFGRSLGLAIGPACAYGSSPRTRRTAHEWRSSATWRPRGRRCHVSHVSSEPSCLQSHPACRAILLVGHPTCRPSYLQAILLVGHPTCRPSYLQVPRELRPRPRAAERPSAYR